MKTLYLIRGIPGSGKTTLACLLEDSFRSKAVDCFCVAADDYFADPITGEYKFDASKLKDVHNACLRDATAALSMGIYNVVIVHNTFTRHWEMQPYKDMAKAAGWNVFEIACLNDFGSIHDVPADKVQAMRERFEYCPPALT